MTSVQAPTTSSLPSTPSAGALRTVWLAALLLTSLALPFIFLPMEAHWAHMVFHLIGIPLCLAGVVLLARIRHSSASRTIRVMTWITTAFFIGWLIGHLGELMVVLGHGGAHADDEVFDNPVHRSFAALAVPSWMLAVVGSIMLLVTIGIVSLRHRRHR